MFEYKVVPAPTRGLKAKGVKGTQDRFANALQSMMNELGVEGWEYQRTDTLPVEERQGLTGKTTTFQNMLVFRRTLAEVEVQPEVAALIEDQSDSVEERPAIIEEITQDESPIEAEQIVAQQPDESGADEAKARVDEALKSEPFAFPWDRRSKSAKTSNDDTQLPAE